MKQTTDFRGEDEQRLDKFTRDEIQTTCQFEMRLKFCL